MDNPNFRFGFGAAYKPHLDGVAVTPDDATLLPYTATSLWIGGAGNVSILTPYGSTLVFTAVAAGTLLPFAANRVNATGTTATLIVAGY
jgi:hypothetical protein